MKVEQIRNRIEQLLLPGHILLDNGATAKSLGWSPNTLNVARSKGLGPSYTKTGGKIGYLPEDIAEFIVASTVKTA